MVSKANKLISITSFRCLILVLQQHQHPTSPGTIKIRNSGGSSGTHGHSPTWTSRAAADLSVAGSEMSSTLRSFSRTSARYCRWSSSDLMMLSTCTLTPMVAAHTAWCNLLTEIYTLPSTTTSRGIKREEYMI